MRKIIMVFSVVAFVANAGALAQVSSVAQSGSAPTVVKTAAPAIDSASKATQQTEPWVQLVTGIAWPLSLVAIVLLFAFHPRLNRFLGLTKAIRKIKAAGVEMEISAEAVDAVRAELRASTRGLVQKAKDEYDRMADVQRISEYLQEIMVVALPRVLNENGLREPPPNMRGTIHVHDIVFREYLYQLVDYFPTRRGAGRRFPQRYGIIGRSWRLTESLGEGNAFEAGKGEERTLIEEWGMTREDVRARGQNQPAYLSVILRGILDNEFANGILYADSTKINAFGDDALATRIAVQLEKAQEVISLRSALEKMLPPLRMAAPNLDIRQLSE